MPYKLPEVPDETPATYDEYVKVQAQLDAAQRDRSWLAVCFLVNDDVDGARTAAAQADEAHKRAMTYYRRHQGIVDRLIDEKYIL